ncbi:hypothetical protein COLO4_25805 [Corchorus olitorius]|uniref:Reverse transcriptase zinc-binding domain-containing protein n=1 Tax=Corchorus olitorius TaxID=93759 RepID=A0A1R3HZU4_9ROSI|nr:hypothetical protein COLO4_25805 [Corchorus olitorius]
MGSTSEKRKLHFVNWETVTNSKEDGWLGIRAAKLLNNAFMAKLGWEIIHNDSATWVKSELGPLRDILHGPWSIEDLQLTVRDVINEDEDWDFSHISYHLPNHINQSLRAIPFQQFATGKTASAGKTIIMAIFLSPLAHNKIATKSLLNHIGIGTDIMCPMCNAHPETVEHLFRNCTVAISLCNQFKPPDISPQSSFFDWLKVNCSFKDASHFLKIPWNIVFCFAIWLLWNTKNCKLFDPGKCSKDPIYDIIDRSAEFFDVCAGSIRTIKRANYIGWMLDGNTGVRVLDHVLREGNSCADGLAKLGTSQDHNFRSFESAPDCIKLNVFVDTMGICYPRMMNPTNNILLSTCNELHTCNGPVNPFVDRETSVSRPFVGELNAPRDV